MFIDAEVYDAFSGLIGKQCCRKRVGEFRSLSIGFGEKIPHVKSRAVDAFYGEWEIGTYSSAWRIVCEDKIICASMNLVDSSEELDQQLQSIFLGGVVSVEMTSLFDIRVNLDNGVFIDFICVSADDDEMFHIFGPDYRYVDFIAANGWGVGKSNVPWKR
ncbi:MAG TPA: hypothetical protein VN030_11665 [Cellvibrio sp.]|nr:hypothetical protein [Cellvibrio sp.]